MLPQELIDDIIDNVANTTTKFGPQNSLSSCALVCRSFLPRSQMHLFSKIKICARSRTFGNHHKTERSKRTKEFLDILKHRPLITDYIRELHLVVSELDKGYLLDDPNLHSIMEKKQKSRNVLRKLTMESITPNLQLVGSPRLHNNFFQPFISPFITSLYMTFIDNINTDVLKSCLNLTDLTLLRVNLEIAKSSAHKSNIRPRIQKLDIGDSRPALAKLYKSELNDHGSLSCLDFTQLQSLIVRTDDLYNNLSFEQEFVDEVGSSLELLSLRVADVDFYSRRQLSLNCFLNIGQAFCLRRLEFYVYFRGGDDPKCRLETLYDVLTTLPPSNQLENLQLTIYVEAAVGQPGSLPEAGWEQLLQEITRLSSGKQFSLFLHVVYEVGDEGECGVIPSSIIEEDTNAQGEEFDSKIAAWKAQHGISLQGLIGDKLCLGIKSPNIKAVSECGILTPSGRIY